MRGIATGDMFRRLVSRVLARQFADDFDRATRPYQFALQARAGTDCLAAMLRAAVELDGRAVIVSLDGRSAYDTVSRAAFLTKVQEVVPTLLPVVRAFYGRTSEYLWWDAEGRRHTIQQGDGCEQGDALAPALFALAQHLALDTAQAGLREGEFLAAFLDDLYIVTWPERARQAYDLVTYTVELHAGVAANQGKTRGVWHRGWGPRRKGGTPVPAAARASAGAVAGPLGGLGAPAHPGPSLDGVCGGRRIARPRGDPVVEAADSEVPLGDLLAKARGVGPVRNSRVHRTPGLRGVL